MYFRQKRRIPSTHSVKGTSRRRSRPCCWYYIFRSYGIPGLKFLSYPARNFVIRIQFQPCRKSDMTPMNTAHDNTQASATSTVKAENTNPLQRLADTLKPDMDAVNTLIIDRMQSDIPLIPQLAGHLIAGGGKRIRPLLTLASASLFDYQGAR